MAAEFACFRVYSACCAVLCRRLFGVTWVVPELRVRLTEGSPNMLWSVVAKQGLKKRRTYVARGAVHWAYGYADLGRLLGTTADGIRMRVFRGWSPTLENVCRAWCEKAGGSDERSVEDKS